MYRQLNEESVGGRVGEGGGEGASIFLCRD